MCKNSLAQRGFTMMEVMIAAGLVGFIAIALLPALFSIADNSKVPAFREQCAAMVRAKLNEYQKGMADSAMGTNYIPSGFEYTKYRYLQYGAGVCTPTAPPVAAPGFRENVFNNSVVANSSTTESALPKSLKGFQLWVMIRKISPRSISDGQAAVFCPSSAEGGSFYKWNEALRVTVTGMIRITGAAGRNGKKFGKLDDINGGGDPNPLLTCSSTADIYAPQLPFRYILATDGRIRFLQSTLNFTNGLPSATAEAAEAHFRTVWSQDASASNPLTTRTPAIPNIRSFAINPNNASVWVLRPGELRHYMTCNYYSIVMSGQNFTSIPDCRSGFTAYSVDSNIESIAVDFGELWDYTDDRVFGLFNSGSGTGSTGGDIRQFDYTSTQKWIAPASTLTLPTNRPRIKGIFVQPTFPRVDTPSLFFFDNTCYTGQGTTLDNITSTTFCASVFSAADTNQTQEMRELPLQIEGVSP